MYKRLISILLTVVMTASCMSVVYAKNRKYLALGDSIANGYGLESESQRYTDIFAAKNSLDLTNMAEDGLTSAELLENIKNGVYPIADADVITVSIGSNDLIQPLLVLIAQEIGADLTGEDDVYTAIEERIYEIYDNGNGIDQLGVLFRSLSKNLAYNKDIIAAADEFAQNTLPEIITQIQALNPDADIYVTNIYNPYYKVRMSIMLSATASAYVDLGDICQTYVDEINTVFENPEGYTLVDIADYFTSRVLTNATRDIWIESILDCSIDPHPDSSGHTVIAFALSNVYDGGLVYGDANSDGDIDAADAAKILQYVLNKSAVSMTDEELLKSDVNGDDEIDASDAASVLQKTLNADYTFTINI